MKDLNTLIDPEQLGAGPHGPDELSWANAINDAGQIVAGGWNWYLLTPTPEGVPGDYNNNGVVDAADYVMWRNGDSPDDTQAGYNLWKANFGKIAGNSATLTTIPEPSTLLFTVAVLATLSLCHRTNQRRRS